jgi:SAM-dependent methyltransferase/ADP-heptose:LPS heptosyltransferase
MLDILHEFKHGLGDCVQFTAVLNHLKRHRSDWHNDVVATAGKGTAFHGLARNVLASMPDTSPYFHTFRHGWHECRKTYKDSPSTKAAQCLWEVFGVPPEWELLRYTIDVRPETQDRAKAFIDTLPPAKGIVGIHYQGNTSQDKKDLDHATVKAVCEYLTKLGYIALIFDWDWRSPLPDGKTIHCPNVEHPLWNRQGTGDAETIAAVIGLCSLFIGIDSGPQKAALATNTPTICVWTGHHPIHYADNAPNAVHLVPAHHADLIRGNKADGLAFFTDHYKHVVYRNDLAGVLIDQSQVALGLKLEGRLLTSTAYDDHYYLEHLAAGLDYLGHGDWQRDYGQWIVSALDLKDKTILDVGCACGSIAAGLAEAGALVSGCDLSEYMIQLGRSKWLKDSLFVCDAVNLHYWADGTFDLVHSNQVCEHWRPDLVPPILKELLRVTRPGGYYFQVGDTEEMFAKQGRTMDKEDPTHICVRSRRWWDEQLAAAGWEVVDLGRVKDHPGSFWRRYPDWEGWLCRRRAYQTKDGLADHGERVSVLLSRN